MVVSVNQTSKNSTAGGTDHLGSPSSSSRRMNGFRLHLLLGVKHLSWFGSRQGGGKNLAIVRCWNLSAKLLCLVFLFVFIAWKWCMNIWLLVLILFSTLSCHSKWVKSTLSCFWLSEVWSVQQLDWTALINHYINWHCRDGSMYEHPYLMPCVLKITLISWSSTLKFLPTFLHQSYVFLKSFLHIFKCLLQ